MVRTRIIFGTLMTLAALGIMVLDAICAASRHSVESSELWQRMLSRGGPSTLLVFILTLIAAVEFNTLLALRGTRPLRSWTLLVVGVLVLVPWIVGAALDDGQAAALLDLRITLSVTIVGLLGASTGLIIRRNPARGLDELGGAALAMVYLGLFMSFAVRLRLILPGPAGAWLLLIWVLIVKLTDVGAFFSGLAVGRRPLIPAISPKKTVEGFFGGVAVGVLAGILGWFALPAVRPAFGHAGVPGFLYLLVFAVVMSFLGQIGDLVESLLKRSAAAKDSGSVVPTFGGILDVVDSLVLTAPAAWLMLSHWHSEG